VIVSVDSPFLAGGFVVADTPGLASLNPAHRRATLAYLPRTDAVLYLIDTQPAVTEGDAAFLGLIGEPCARSSSCRQRSTSGEHRKATAAKRGKSRRERIARRAAQYAPAAEVHSVSARDYAVGTLEGDAGLVERSGFPALLAGSSDRS